MACFSRCDDATFFYEQTFLSIHTSVSPPRHRTIAQCRPSNPRGRKDRFIAKNARYPPPLRVPLHPRLCLPYIPCVSLHPVSTHYTRLVTQELGAQLLGVLVRNPSLFQSLAAAALAPDEPHPSSAIGEQGLTAGGGAGEGRASASKSVVTEVTAPPTPPSETAIVRMVGGGGGQGGGGDGDGECEDGDAAMGVLGESFLRRLCLDAVTTGEHASFGEVHAFYSYAKHLLRRLCFFFFIKCGVDIFWIAPRYPHGGERVWTSGFVKEDSWRLCTSCRSSQCNDVRVNRGHRSSCVSTPVFRCGHFDS